MYKNGFLKCIIAALCVWSSRGWSWRLPQQHGSSLEHVARSATAKAILVAYYADRFHLHNVTLGHATAQCHYETRSPALLMDETTAMQTIVIQLGGMAAHFFHEEESSKTPLTHKTFVHLAGSILATQKDPLDLLTHILIEDGVLPGDLVMWYVRGPKNDPEASY